MLTYKAVLGQQPKADQNHILPNPFLQITREELDNALNDVPKTSDLHTWYRSEVVRDIRIQKVKLLHSAPWQTLEEEVVHKDHWWPPVPDEARSVKGKWMTYYPPESKLAKITLAIDWRAYSGDARKPLMECTIDVPASEFHPGRHRGTLLPRMNTAT